MKLYDGGLVITGIIIVVLVIGYTSSRWLGGDNPIEESAESVIREQTGVDLILSSGCRGHITNDMTSLRTSP